ncbi:pheromone-regulated multispanning membrane protein Prm1, putative [Talaromyces stipitatus ATCC 10500]|uniref:Plasma membrane fusion protein PRM1 n=1 Tax=Talaromyces stipitatus (strain ATCC 10500 / CBS 375.48 / QM 6759 / NRRL 1006) TaxID=441959 RepID=B8LWN2_TALSN|nr:pheromone-regulated multispanning membrane protein Prm1, putative [Talaromyces stipitatus ATCC 10500]EED24429.1 pheromone-regulated multispanning membrane protein Prm1, putative [Talaromyces stipitatus ATCC 10500]
MRLFGGRTIFPMLPPYGAHDGSDAPPPYANPDKPTPYLGLKARLSQIWINRWTILILLVLVRVLLATTGLQGDMANARLQALSACNSVQSAGSSMASLPHYMAQGVNELTASGVTSAVNGLVEVLQLMITGIEALVVFYINFLTQMYLCLFTLVARGAAETALGLAKEVTDWLNQTLPTIEDDISGAVKTASDGLNDLGSALDSLKKDCNNVFTKSLCGAIPSIPTLDFTSQIDELKNLSLPSSINDDIDKVNKTIPTFDQVKNATTTAIEYPFEQLKKLINDNLGNYSFDSSAFPVPAKQSLSFCGENDGINDFFQKTTDIILVARKVFIAVLVIFAVLACIPMAWMEIRSWRLAKERARIIGTGNHDSLDVVYLVSRPHTSSWGMRAATWFNNSRHQILVRWIFAYATSIPALVLLSLGLAGLFACLCQYILLKAVEKEVPELTAEVSQFADKVIDSLNNASAQWALSTNHVINTTNTDLNKNLFGWVNTSTTALNDTLNTFLDKSNEVINTTFSGTPLYGAVSGIFDCVVELKIESVQKGLTWAHDHAHITLPQLPNNTFSIGAAKSADTGDSFLSDPGSTTSNQITEVVNNVVTKLQDGIETEAKIASILVLLWFLLVLVGILRALMICCKRERVRGNGGGQENVVIGGPIEPAAFHTTGNTAMMTGGRSTRSVGGDMQQVPLDAPAHDHDSCDYEDQKVGYAGERDYSSAVHADTRKSAYVEYASDEKRR